MKLDLDSIERTVSVNSILLELENMDLSDDKIAKWVKYMDSLQTSNLLKIIDITHFYNKDHYDFYFILEEPSSNWSKKIILKSNIVDLVLKYKLLHYITIKYFNIKKWK